MWQLLIKSALHSWNYVSRETQGWQFLQSIQYFLCQSVIPVYWISKYYLTNKAWCLVRGELWIRIMYWLNIDPRHFISCIYSMFHSLAVHWEILAANPLRKLEINGQKSIQKYSEYINLQLIFITMLNAVSFSVVQGLKAWWRWALLGMGRYNIFADTAMCQYADIADTADSGKVSIQPILKKNQYRPIPKLYRPFVVALSCCQDFTSGASV